MAKYNVGDNINFLEYEYKLKSYSEKFWWGDQILNDIIFRLLNLNEANFSEKLLGYYMPCGNNSFPEMKTLEDVEKLTDALLLECAKFRYPIGTKYKSAYDNVPDGEVTNLIFSNKNVASRNKNGRLVYIYYAEKQKWAEIISEAEKEFKFEKGKWYELKYTFRDKLCNTLLKSTTDSFDKVYFDGYYDLEEECWREAISFSIDSSIKIIYVQERSLEEIQQYLPDGHPDKISKQFVLPERWHVVVTEENKEVLSKWRFKGSNNKLSVGKITGICDHKKNPEHNPIGKIKSDNYDFGVEITFEQFKKHVLKENIKSSEPTKPNFDNCKIWIGDNPELSKKVQEKLFELGYSWRGGDETIQMCEAYCLFTHPDKDITHQQKDRVYFIKQSKREIFPSDLGIIVEEEFKVGDILYFLNDKKTFSAPTGSIARCIAPFDGKYIKIEWIDKKGTEQSDGEYKKERFRKARPEEIPFNIKWPESWDSYRKTGFFIYPEIKLKNPFLGFRNVYLGTGMMPFYVGIDPVSEPKITLSIDDDELPMVRPREEVKVTKQLSID